MATTTVKRTVSGVSVRIPPIVFTCKRPRIIYFENRLNTQEENYTGMEIGRDE